MRIVLQRVNRAAVRVDGEVVGDIGKGLLALVGVERGDGADEVARAAQRLVELRIFEDDAGRMNHDVTGAGGAVLVVSQFTLAADLSRGRRPSFGAAAPPELAEPLVARLVEDLRARGVGVATGRFGARMEVELINAGPVTFVLEIVPTGSAPQSTAGA
ncbi:MAG: D-aminoacyl-tRNA deacylase [Thermoanaerobaculia bacterium]